MNSGASPSFQKIRVANGRQKSFFLSGGLLSLLLVLEGFFSPVRAEASDRWEVLQAIHWVENPDNSPAPGPYGELGAYQFRRSTWKSHTTKPFEYAREREHSDEVAIKHYEWLKRGFERAGLSATPYRIALAWNAGLTATLSGRVPTVTHQYATRVTNIVESLKQRTAKSEGQ